MLQNHWLGYPDTTMRNRYVSQYCHGNADKHFLSFYNYIKTIHGENLIYLLRKLCVSKKICHISNQAVQKGDIFLPDFYYYNIGHHVAGFVFTLPKSNHLHKLLTPRNNWLNEATPKTTNLFSSNVFKLPQETLVKTAIENYI